MARLAVVSVVLPGLLGTCAASAATMPPSTAEWSLFGENITAPGDRTGYYTAETVQHWPAGRVIRNVSHPSLQPFLVDSSHPRFDGTAVIVAPGGAYKWLTWDAEGVDIATWLNSLGISAFVLKYRVPFRPWLCRPGFGCRSGEAPLIDAQRAVGLLRSRSRALGLNASRIGFIGFSAGGHLTAHISTNNSNRLYPRIDSADDLSCRPDFAMMVYPAYLINETAPTSDPSQVMLKVTQDHPPAFLAQTEDDGIKVENSL